MSEVTTSDAMGCAECRRQLAASQALCREMAEALQLVIDSDVLPDGIAAHAKAFCARVLEEEK